MQRRSTVLQNGAHAGDTVTPFFQHPGSLLIRATTSNLFSTIRAHDGRLASTDATLREVHEDVNGSRTDVGLKMRLSCSNIRTMPGMQRHLWIVVTVAAACGGVTRGGSQPDGGDSAGPPTLDGRGPTDATGGEAEADAETAVDVGVPPACLLNTSSYDQSCEEDSDCVPQVFGDICNPMMCICSGSGYINKNSSTQYNTDFMRALALRPSNGVACDCNMPPAGCCTSGKCEDCSGPEMGLGSVDAALDAPTE
jgi:hypothetical protein